MPTVGKSTAAMYRTMATSWKRSITAIVLLDETTSSLDADNEKEIHKALDALMKDKTVIVIAHRLNTIIGADQILVLDEGIICERGNHKELLAQNGWYARMISEQTKAREWSVE